MCVRVYEEQQKVGAEQIICCNYLTWDKDGNIRRRLDIALCAHLLPGLPVIFLSVWSWSSNIVFFLLIKVVLIFTIQLYSFLLCHRFPNRRFSCWLSREFNPQYLPFTYTGLSVTYKIYQSYLWFYYTPSCSPNYDGHLDCVTGHTLFHQEVSKYWNWIAP